ncbi:MAG: glutaminyl-peptide cyclotransferase [Halanaerobiales bacterium]
MNKYIILSILIISTIFLYSSATAEPPHYTYNIVNTYPHDREAFTQGLLYKDGYLYEGTGLYGESSLRKVDLETGKIIKIKKLSDEYFGEGITIFKDKIYQLTWKAKTGFVYNMDFELIDQFDYPGEGWGITHDGENLIMSDGTENIYFLDPDTLEEVKKIKVKIKEEPVLNINELEYIKGEIYANIWQENHLIKIDPETGNVTGIIDLTGIIEREKYNYEIDVLNGIAYDKESERIFITGKLWPLVFEIDIIPVKEDK